MIPRRNRKTFDIENHFSNNSKKDKIHYFLKKPKNSVNSNHLKHCIASPNQSIVGQNCNFERVATFMPLWFDIFFKTRENKEILKHLPRISMTKTHQIYSVFHLSIKTFMIFLSNSVVLLTRSESEN